MFDTINLAQFCYLKIHLFSIFNITNLHLNSYFFYLKNKKRKYGSILSRIFKLVFTTYYLLFDNKYIIYCYIDNFDSINLACFFYLKIHKLSNCMAHLIPCFKIHQKIEHFDFKKSKCSKKIRRIRIVILYIFIMNCYFNC